MLTELSIQNLAIADRLTIEWHKGMTAISGETGAGKSILLEALGLCIGDRAASDIVRHGSDRADISASFDLSGLAAAVQWLKEKELQDGEECIIRRTISKEGRSKAYINGSPVPLADLKILGAQLLDIHAQHEHHALMQAGAQTRLLDSYGGLETLKAEVGFAFSNWKQLSTRLSTIRSGAADSQAKLQLLTYQVEEFDQLALKAGEVEQLEEEQHQLAHAEDLLGLLNNASENLLSGEGGLNDQFKQLSSCLKQALQFLPALSSTVDMIEEARIRIEEVDSDVRRSVDAVEVDPERLREVEARLSQIYLLARKHHCEPQDLETTYEQLSAELAELAAKVVDPEVLEATCKAAEKTLLSLSHELGKQRRKVAEELGDKVVAQLKALDIKADLAFELRQLDEPSPSGSERVEICISLNPGQPRKPLRKVASGGELSRISLAIQVATVAKQAMPTIVFDEVDVGIGGGTAEIVGRMLKEIGAHSQVLCITHLPQVASCAHQHLMVSKAVENGATKSSAQHLVGKARTAEIARMLGGIEITRKTLAHAEEMLQLAS